MANLAQQLGMHIDTFRLGEVEHFNIMKRLSDITEGKYSYSNDSSTILKEATDMGESNIQAHGAAYQKGKGFTQVLKKIAAPLLTEAEMDQRNKRSTRFDRSITRNQILSKMHDLLYVR